MSVACLAPVGAPGGHPGGRLRGACRVPVLRLSGACRAPVRRMSGAWRAFVVCSYLLCADSRHAHQLCAQGGAALRRNSVLGGLRQTHRSGLYSAQALAIRAVTMRATICMLTMCVLGVAMCVKVGAYNQAHVRNGACTLSRARLQ